MTSSSTWIRFRQNPILIKIYIIHFFLVLFFPKGFRGFSFHTRGGGGGGKHATRANEQVNTARVLFARVTSAYVPATKNNGRRWGTKGTFRKHSRNNRVNVDRSYASLATPFVQWLLAFPAKLTIRKKRKKGKEMIEGKKDEKNPRSKNSWNTATLTSF